MQKGQELLLGVLAVRALGWIGRKIGKLFVLLYDESMEPKAAQNMLGRFLMEGAPPLGKRAMAGQPKCVLVCGLC